MGRRKDITIDDRAFMRKLSKFSGEFPDETKAVLTEIVLDLAGKSAERAPVETGDLRNNCVARVDDTVIFENQSMTGSVGTKARRRVRATVGYSLPYALRQHEDFTLDHGKTDGKPRYRAVRHTTKGGTLTSYIGPASVNRVAGGEAKYLENPFRENQEKYRELLREVPKKALEKSFGR